MKHIIGTIIGMAAGFLISLIGFLLLAILFGYGDTQGRLDPVEGVIEFAGTIVGGYIGWRHFSDGDKNS